MRNKLNYQSIKNSVVYSFEEYIEDDGFTAAQSAAKVFEEEWRELNYNRFTKAAYYICIAIECFKLNEIPDFIYEKLDVYIHNKQYENENNRDDVETLIEDIEKCLQLMERKDYKIIESAPSAKSRIEYILSLKL